MQRGTTCEIREPKCYFGVNRDQRSLHNARTSFLNHQCVSDQSSVADQCDTIIGLAVLEHVDNPQTYLPAFRQPLKTRWWLCCDYDASSTYRSGALRGRHERTA